MIRFPYGISNFKRIREDGFLYLDRTQHLALLEEAGEQLVFLRPRRFGKSLLLSTLANYYDIKMADQFDMLFSGLEAGHNPTPERNRYLILRWDFSKVSAQGDIDDIKSSLLNHLNETIETFKRDYIATDISLQPRFHDLCGITIQELDTLVDQVLKQCREGNDQRENLLQTLKRFYNGYRFCDQADTSLLYNPSACLYLHHYQDGYTTPHPMPDNSLMADTPYIHCLMSQSSGNGKPCRIT